MPEISRPAHVLPEQPSYRPLERFWPYAELTEQPSDEELAQLHPELRAVLLGGPVLPFSISIAFPAFAGEAYAPAVELAKASDEYTELVADGVRRHCGRFYPGERARQLRSLYELVGAVPGSDVLVDDRPVPGARDLWLPLVWFLIK